MRLDNILGDLIGAVTGRDQQQQPAPPADVRPASEDPFGDPADQQANYQGQQVLPASQDPFGDPADQVNGQQVLPASQDPFGDPADQPGSHQGQQVLPA